mgnify:CR=1 FL=1
MEKVMQDNDYKNSLGYRLSRIRFEFGLNKKQLADKLYISQQCITRYEKNEREPDYSYILNLVDKCNVNLEYVFGKSDIIFNDKKKRES